MNENNKVSQLRAGDIKVLNFEELCVPEVIFPVEDLLESLNQGVIVLENHMINEDLILDAYNDSFEFFKLDSRTKLKYSYKDNKQGAYGNTGYFPIGSEKALEQDVTDYKEFFHVGRNMFPVSYSDYYSKNYWPDEIENFQSSFSSLFNQFEYIGNVLCSFFVL